MDHQQVAPVPEAWDADDRTVAPDSRTANSGDTQNLQHYASEAFGQQTRNLIDGIADLYYEVAVIIFLGLGPVPAFAAIQLLKFAKVDDALGFPIVNRLEALDAVLLIAGVVLLMGFSFIAQIIRMWKHFFGDDGKEHNER